MTKLAHNDVIDGGLDYIKANADKMIACPGDPANYTAATTSALATVAMATTDFTIADDTSGRKVTMATKTGITIGTTGTAAHVVLVDVGSTALLYKTTCNSIVLTSGQTMSFQGWKIQIKDPT